MHGRHASGFRPAARHRVAASSRTGASAAGARGFTLVELMVVLVIVGLMGTAVMLTAPGDSHVLAREAETFAMRLKRAQEEAILGTRAVEVTVTTHGYDFARQRFGGWQPLHDGPFGPVSWNEGTQPQLGDDRKRITFRFDPAGEARVETLTLLRDGQRMHVGVDAAARIAMREPAVREPGR